MVNGNFYMADWKWESPHPPSLRRRQSIQQASTTAKMWLTPVRLRHRLSSLFFPSGERYSICYWFLVFLCLNRVLETVKGGDWVHLWHHFGTHRKARHMNEETFGLSVGCVLCGSADRAGLRGWRSAWFPFATSRRIGFSQSQVGTCASFWVSFVVSIPVSPETRYTLYAHTTKSFLLKGSSNECKVST